MVTTAADALGSDVADPAELVARAQAGDADAFADLYDRYVDGVYGYVHGRVRDRALAEDLTSDVFLNALRRIDSFRWRGVDIGAWLMVIARNRLHDHFKSARTRFERPTDELVDDVSEAGYDDPECAAEMRDLTRALREALDRLPTAHREVIELRFMHELSIADTAAVIGRSAAATKALQYRALKGLAELARANPRLAALATTGVASLLSLVRAVL